MAKDNTLLYVGVAVAAYLFLNRRSSIPQMETGQPQVSPQYQQLADDIASGDVVLEIEKPPVVADTRDYALIAECYAYRDSGISRFVYGSKCDGII